MSDCSMLPWDDLTISYWDLPSSDKHLILKKEKCGEKRWGRMNHATFFCSVNGGRGQYPRSYFLFWFEQGGTMISIWEISGFLRKPPIEVQYLKMLLIDLGKLWHYQVPAHLFVDNSSFLVEQYGTAQKKHMKYWNGGVLDCKSSKSWMSQRLTSWNSWWFEGLPFRDTWKFNTEWWEHPERYWIFTLPGFTPLHGPQVLEKPDLNLAPKKWPQKSRST